MQATSLFPLDLALDEETFRHVVATVARHGGLLGGVTFLGQAPDAATDRALDKIFQAADAEGLGALGAAPGELACRAHKRAALGQKPIVSFQGVFIEFRCGKIPVDFARLAQPVRIDTRIGDGVPEILHGLLRRASVLPAPSSTMRQRLVYLALKLDQ